LNSQLSHAHEKVHHLEKDLEKVKHDRDSEVKSLKHQIKELEEKVATGGGHDDDFDRYAF